MATQPIEYERFPHAPIVEAILSVGVAPHAPLDESSVAAFHERVRDGYPHQGQGIRIESTIEVSPEEGSIVQSVDQRRIGYGFRAPDDSAVIRVLHDGFSYHHLASYPGWSEFSEHARAAWDAYVDVFSPERVEKIGLRYLDRIELPLPFADLKEYLRTYPEVAPNIDTGFAGYLLRLVFPRPEIPAVGYITQSIEPVRVDRGVIPLIFDVDVMREGALPMDNDLLWDTLERLRVYKNQLFFESITEKTKELFR